MRTEPITCVRLGDTVTPNPDHAWVYCGTEKEAVMNAPRTGTVIEVPMAAEQDGNGLGTVRVRWNSLTARPLMPHRAEHWHHTDLLLAVVSEGAA